MTIRAPLLLSLALGLVTPLAAQDQPPQSLPIRATAELDATALASSGRAPLRLSFTTEEVLLRALAVRIELRHGKELVQRRDHAPPVASKQWGRVCGSGWNSGNCPMISCPINGSAAAGCGDSVN